MTAKEHIAQRDLVTASLASVHHPDVYARARVVPGEQRAARQQGDVPTRVHAPGGEEAGCASRPPAPTTRECPACKGTGELHFTGQSLHPSAGVYVTDPQEEDFYECRKCAGTGSLPIPRPIPGTRRVA